MKQGAKVDRYAKASTDNHDGLTSNRLSKNSSQKRTSIPFDLAGSILSPDSTSVRKSMGRNDGKKGPATISSLAQKMHHMVTADNDLSRKTVTSIAAFYQKKKSNLLDVSMASEDGGLGQSQNSRNKLVPPNVTTL